MVNLRFQRFRVYKGLVLLANWYKLFSLNLIYTITYSWKIHPLSPPQESTGTVSVSSSYFLTC